MGYKYVAVFNGLYRTHVILFYFFRLIRVFRRHKILAQTRIYLTIYFQTQKKRRRIFFAFFKFFSLILIYFAVAAAALSDKISIAFLS